MKENSDRPFFIACLLCASVLFVFAYGRELVLYFLWHRFVSAGVIASLVTILGFWANLIIERRKEKTSNFLHQKSEDSVLLGKTFPGKDVYLPMNARTMHAQCVGTTNAGKTESVIVPWAVSDIASGRGCVLIDGKSDTALLDKLYGYCVKHGRTKDFRLLSLVNTEESSSYNPLAGGSPEEVTERVFSALDFEDEYYRNIQYEVLKHVLIVFEQAKVVPTFQRVIQVLTNTDLLKELAENLQDETVSDWIKRFSELPKDAREKRTSGLLTQLGHFATGHTAVLFNDESPAINIEQVIREGMILYCQLPVLKTPVLGRAAGKMILQSIQSAVSTRHLEENKNQNFFGIYLDDFTEYLTPGFVSLLNKSRSANVGVTFAHQALGDLEKLGTDVKNTILTNSNIKVFMRTSEPESAEYFAKTLGTVESEKRTSRERKSLFGAERTGEASVRDVEQFKFHPNLFKNLLGRGDAIILVPNEKGSQAVQLHFQKLPDLDRCKRPKGFKNAAELVKPKPKKPDEPKTEAPKCVSEVLGVA